VEQGVNHIDTATFYFSPLRSANELINRALSSWRDDVVVVTKVGPGRDPSGEWTAMVRPDQLRGQVEENLRQLGRDHLDVVNLRRNPRDMVSVAEHFGALAELREAGLIRHLGLSHVRPEHVAEARAIAPVVCVQNAYSLDWRRSDENGLVDLCRELGIAFVSYSPSRVCSARRPPSRSRTPGFAGSPTPAASHWPRCGSPGPCTRARTCCGHPGHRQPGPSRREHRRGRSAVQRRGVGPSR
jgi:aryl-alcohol dehydrogenase-like predicted oxidoreductase